MIIGKKEILLKNGQKAILQSPLIKDAKALIQHIYKTAEETYYMARYPEEIVITEEEQKERLKSINAATCECMLVAYIEGELVGHAGIQRIKNHIKYLHRGYLGISIQKKACNLGLGTLMIEELLSYAKQMGFEQIELGVFADNERARHLYEKMGFKQVGVQPRAFKLKDGTYRDEVQMIYMIEK
ncbi:MAG: GNAT family N-acetyltransferase [Cellulosilyticum sp.]|nr:GNAT family N-acetyltransferase [Cellulosilyticum sp.]MEE1073428.1 GNAT family N-acetyltransferase [Cellulosilyticum sp.]